jgi:thiol:disulfide interchange protein
MPGSRRAARALRASSACVGAAALALCVVASPAAAQRPGLERAKLGLASDRTAHRAGETARIAAVVDVEPGWHIQSHTPTFDYLIPTELTVEVPAGWRAAQIEYPPHQMWTAQFEPDAPLAVYQGRVRILATVAVPADWKEGAAGIGAKLRYQACDERQCLPPRDATASLVLTIGDDGEPANEDLFGGSSAGAPPAAGGGSSAASTALDTGARSNGAAAPRDATHGSGAAPSTSRAPNARVASSGAIGWSDLFGKLLLGVLGGLILNAMPCVLPVLSLKLAGILQHAGGDRRAIARGGLATSAGIVTSFVALALLAIGVRAAGGLVGWGVQFQNPAFVVFLLLVVVLFCLNLWGVFEVPLPRFLSQFGGGGHDGVLGHFVTGLFATLMATPCSAPFLGTAVGFGLSQSAGVILAVFVAIGIGMALPYLFMAAVPGSVARLPRPGAWMLQLKVVLGFLLAGAAVWLLYVLSAQVSPERLAAIEVGLLVLSLLVWLGGSPESTRATRTIGRAGALIAIAGTIFLAARATPVAIAVARPPEQGGAIDWTTFDRGRAESLARDGRLVFVDVTADWCFTCKANERLILDTSEVTDAFVRHQVIAMRADWTNQNEAIARFLADFGRYSIPFYLLYRPGAEPHLFSELLTKRDVLRVLDESAGREAHRE